MLFSSITFLYYFLPAFLILYFAAPKKLKNSVILISSLFFYAWGEPLYVILMIVSVLSGYVFGLFIHLTRGTVWSKVLCGISVAVSLSFLVYFKYADFFIENFNLATGLSVGLLNIALPIGISFYTFQIISYTVDVYRGEPAQKNIINLGAYIAMFPQLIAGPIVRYSDVARQLGERTHSFSMASYGIRRFMLGLSKKILIANQLGELCNVFRECEEKSVMFYWLYAVTFALHIYFDFSGYSDMAIGLGKIMGFDFLENFNYPFISKSVTEFWRRWHMSLGTWFRDYLYIPLGGNRVKTPRWIFNILVVWLATGFWHGAEWNFIVWGLMFAVLLMVEKFFLKKILDKVKPLAHLYVAFVVLISFVIFNANDMTMAISDLGGMFGVGGVPFVSAPFFYYLRDYALVLIIAAVGSTPLMKTLMEKLSKKPALSKIINVAEPVVLLVLLAVVTAYLVDGSFNPFLYFRF